MATHAFLSHVTQDAKLVSRLKADLDADEPISWLAHDRILPGDVWMDEIRRAIAEGTFFIACFSAASAARDKSVMNEELLLAIDEMRQRPQHHRWFIPIKLTPCDIPNLNIGGGQTLHSIHHLEMYPDWDESVQKLKHALGLRVSTAPARRRLSAMSMVLMSLTALVVTLYGVLLARFWPVSVDADASNRVQRVEADDAAIGLLAEALAHVKADRIEDAYHAAVSAESAARTAAVQNRAASLRLLLAVSLSEGHQMMGEALVAGREKAAEQDKLRYAELAVGESMQSFKWLKMAAAALDTLSSRKLPEIQFSKVELSNSLGERMLAGMQASEKAKSGRGVPSAAEIEQAVTTLSSQSFRFYVAKAFQADANKVVLMKKDIWNGELQWSPALAAALSHQVIKMSDKGIQMSLAIESRPPEARFDPGRSFGLGEELNLVFCRSLLESFRRYVAATRAKTKAGEDAVTLGALLDDVDRRLLSVAQKKSEKS